MAEETYLTVEQCTYALRRCFEYPPNAQAAANDPLWDEWRLISFRAWWTAARNLESLYLPLIDHLPERRVEVTVFEELCSFIGVELSCVDWRYVNYRSRANLMTGPKQ